MKNNQNKIIKLISLFISILLTTKLLFFSPIWSVRSIGEVLGIGGYLFFSLSLFLGSRWKKLEDWIGGLDQVYHLHHQFGVTGFILLILHPLFIATRWLPNRLDKFLLFTLPIHHRMEINLGAIAFWIMVIIIGITLLRLLPYHHWKTLHQFMSLAYVLGTLHFLLGKPLYFFTFSDFLLYPSCILGLFGVVYKQIYLPNMRKISYEVTKTKKLTDNIIEVYAEPQKTSLKYFPGQYAFCTFYSPNISEEAHPFTMCPHEKGFSILAKIRGDFTKTLYQKVAPGWEIKLEGPYGRFDYKKAGKKQIWIAGGIGVVPFLTWARELAKDKEREIDFFFCIHSKKDKSIFNEFKKIAQQVPSFHPKLFCSEEKNRLNPDMVMESCPDALKRQILMCGPRRLTQAFTKQFLLMGIERKNIFFEDFEFF